MKQKPRISAVFPLFLTAVLIACPKPPQSGKNLVLASRSAVFADLERDLADIAEDCNHELNCYWEKGHDHIEFSACRAGVLALFGSLTECHEDSISTLEDLAVELDLTPKKNRRSRSRRRRRRSSRSGGNSSPDSVTLNRAVYDNICNQPGAQCLSYDDLLAISRSGRNLCCQPANIRAFFSNLSCEDDGNSDETCPSSPPSECKLANVTLVIGSRWGYTTYTRPGGFNLYSSGWRDWLPEGSIDPSPNKIESLYTTPNRLNENTSIALSSTKISAVTDSTNSWYIYMDGTRYSMTERLPRSSNQSPEVYLYRFGKTGLATTTYGIHLAYEDSDGVCHWILP